MSEEWGGGEGGECRGGVGMEDCPDASSVQSPHGKNIDTCDVEQKEQEAEEERKFKQRLVIQLKARLPPPPPVIKYNFISLSYKLKQYSMLKHRQT